MRETTRAPREPSHLRRELDQRRQESRDEEVKPLYGEVLDENDLDKINIVIDTDQISVRSKDHELSVFLLGRFALKKIYF